MRQLIRKGMKWIRSKGKYKEYEWKEGEKNKAIVLRAYGDPKMLEEITFEYKSASGARIFERYTLHKVHENAYTVQWVAYEDGKEVASQKAVAFDVPWYFDASKLEKNVKEYGVRDTCTAIVMHFVHLALRTAWLF